MANLFFFIQSEVTLKRFSQSVSNQRLTGLVSLTLHLQKHSQTADQQKWNIYYYVMLGRAYSVNIV